MSRKSVAVIVIALPAMFALFQAMAFHFGNRNNGSIVSGGEKRDYLLYVPRSYDPAKPAPLVISMHGAGGWPAQQMKVSGWNRVADREGFIVVYPAGLVHGGPRVWQVSDVRFISDLIDKLEGEYNIDHSRIYANGLSNGGGMAFVLSCKLSDRIAAVGMVAAAQTQSWNWCGNARPVPMIAFHGTADPIVPYNGGVSWIAPAFFPNMPLWAAKWARRNRCAGTPVDSRVAADVTRREYTDCAGHAAVVLYTIEGGGHSWPGGQPMPEWFVGRTSSTVDATSLMWHFFRGSGVYSEHASTSGRDFLHHDDFCSE